LEVGPGIGTTTLRLLAQGWHVEALEPDAEMRALYLRNTGRDARAGGIAEGTTLFAPGAFTAAVAESVLYATDLGSTFATLRALLRPGGHVAFTDMVWTAHADPVEVARLHDQSTAAFGLPLASRLHLTWSDWLGILAQEGFSVVEATKLGPGSPGGPSKPRVGWALRDPIAAARALRFRQGVRAFSVPSGWLESWSCLACRRA
jgi:SAM-dependent methyltransferase